MAGLFNGLEDLPQHFFKAMCQDKACHEPLGGFHIPCIGGIAIFICPKCRGVSAFMNKAYGIDAKFAGHPRKTGPGPIGPPPGR